MAGKPVLEWDSLMYNKEKNCKNVLKSMFLQFFSLFPQIFSIQLLMQVYLKFNMKLKSVSQKTKKLLWER